MQRVSNNSNHPWRQDIEKLLQSKFPAEVATITVDFYCQIKPYGKEKAAVAKTLLQNGLSLEQIWMQTGYKSFDTMGMYCRSEY